MPPFEDPGKDDQEVHSPDSETQTVKTWKEAWNASPGPRERKEFLMLFLKGIGMGTADIIPGVSGGTIAFITGIYGQLLNAIGSIDLGMLVKLSQGRFREALAGVHLRFLLVLVIGIILAILSTARLMHFLLNNYPVWTWSLFFGLITASILILARSLDNLRYGLIGILVGTLVAYWVTGMIPVETPKTLSFIFFSGLVAICAMILPGLSGAFILLILGQYAFITSVLRDPFHWDHLQIILVFVLGCLTGILAFSRVLRFCLKKFPQTTLGLLTGFMIGALRKVWPWKIPLETEIIRGKEYVLQEINVLPELDPHLLIACLLMIIGFALVLKLESLHKS